MVLKKLRSRVYFDLVKTREDLALDCDKEEKMISDIVNKG